MEKERGLNQESVNLNLDSPTRLALGAGRSIGWGGSKQQTAANLAAVVYAAQLSSRNDIALPTFGRNEERDITGVCIAAFDADGCLPPISPNTGAE